MLKNNQITTLKKNTSQYKIWYSVNLYTKQCVCFKTSLGYHGKPQFEGIVSEVEIIMQIQGQMVIDVCICKKNLLIRMGWIRILDKEEKNT